MSNNLKGYDAFQVLRSVFDVDMNCLRVCVVDGANPGSSGVIVTITHTDDSIRLGDGTYFFTSTLSGGKVALDVNVINSNLPITIRDLAFATDKVDVTGSSVTVSGVDLDIRDLNFTSDKVDVTGSSVTVSGTDLDIRNLTFATDKVDVSGSTVTEQNSADILNSVQSIDGKLPSLGVQTQSNSVSVTLASDQPNINVNCDLEAFTNVNPDSVQLVGSIDGTKTGQKFGVVNNLRLQILDSHDRVAEFTYADFGTKNQRITQIDYSSATFSGVLVRRVFSYTPVGNNYRRDDETWSLV
jgi:hypothetical protein